MDPVVRNVVLECKVKHVRVFYLFKQILTIYYYSEREKDDKETRRTKRGRGV